MKKINKSATVPAALAEYLQANPNDSWVQFKANCPDGSPQLKQQITADQRGLCAYCEIDLAQCAQGHADFRVDHFIPKSTHNPQVNYGLDWHNMRGVCHGGNQRYGDPARFTAPDLSCDGPKGNQNLLGTILDPLLDIPAFPPLFDFDEDGHMAVATECPAPLQKQAQASIDKLRLSPLPDEKIKSPRLIGFRKAAIEKLRAQLGEHLQTSGQNLDQALAYFAEMYFPSEADAHWPAFFSCIRWYLGQAAEKRLTDIAYQG